VTEQSQQFLHSTRVLADVRIEINTCLAFRFVDQAEHFLVQNEAGRA